MREANLFSGKAAQPSGGKQLPSLGGLRAISAFMVIFGHAEKVLQVGRHLPFGAGVIDALGPIGVSMFFVLSGFLITRLLIAERRSTGKLDLVAFYVRRTFRILPAYWTYVGAIALLAGAGLVIAPAIGFSRALSFTSNYLNPQSWALNHSWSLSVEEQFYLIWPFLLLLTGNSRGRRAAQWFIVLTPVLRVLTFYLAPQLRPSITSMFHLRADALMIGCWAALEHELRPQSRVLSFLRRSEVAAAGAVYCLLVGTFVRRLGLVNVAFGYTVEAFAACSVLLWSVANPEARAGRVLNSRVLVHFGLISYSLYLWQQVWLTHETRTSAWLVLPLICGAMLCAEVSYWFVEKPMLALRDRLAVQRRAARDIGGAAAA